MPLKDGQTRRGQESCTIPQIRHWHRPSSAQYQNQLLYTPSLPEPAAAAGKQYAESIGHKHFDSFLRAMSALLGGLLALLSENAANLWRFLHGRRSQYQGAERGGSNSNGGTVQGRMPSGLPNSVRAIRHSPVGIALSFVGHPVTLCWLLRDESREHNFTPNPWLVSGHLAASRAASSSTHSLSEWRGSVFSTIPAASVGVHSSSTARGQGRDFAFESQTTASRAQRADSCVDANGRSAAERCLGSCAYRSISLLHEPDALSRTPEEGKGCHRPTAAALRLQLPLGAV